MHGKKRAEYKAQASNPKITSALSAKAEQWHTLMKELASRRQQTSSDADGTTDISTHSPTTITTAVTTLALLEKALLVNPDPLNLWNHRREVLLLLLVLEATEEETKDLWNPVPTRTIGRLILPKRVSTCVHPYRPMVRTN